MDKVKNLWIVTAIIVIFNLIGYMTLKGDSLVYVSNLLPIVCSFIAIIGVAYVVRAFKEFDFIKVSWILILLGLVFEFIAESIYAYLEVVLNYDMNEYFPSRADYFWFIGYLFFFISLIQLLTRYLKSGLPLGKIKVYLLIVSALATLIIVIINFLLVPIFTDEETGLTTKVASMFYPVADTLIVCLAVILMYIINQFDNKLISMPWKILALGFICFTVSDLVYSFLSWEGIYGSGNFIDIGWNLGYLLIGISGLYQLKLLKSIQERG